MKKFFKWFGIYVLISLIVCIGALIFFPTSDQSDNQQEQKKTTERESNKKEVDEKQFDYEAVDNFKYVVESLTTMIGDSPNIKWTESKDWVDEETQIQYFTGYVQNYKVADVYYKFRFAGDKCVHFTFGEQTIISDIETEAAWMDDHSK